jgi:hypothetical protein
MPPQRRPVSSTFTQPPRRPRPLKLLVLGEGGAGKTYTALKIAPYFGEPWGALLTGADIGRFDDYREHPKIHKGGWINWCSVKGIEEDYATAHFIKAMTDASTDGFAGLMVDQIGLNWSGPKGILDVVDSKTEDSNKFAAGWTVQGGGNDLFHRLCHSIYTCPIHLIVCCRSKTKFRPKRLENGKIEVERCENEIAHRDGAESLRFVFDYILLMDDDHSGVFLKPNGEAWPEFNGSFQRPGEKVANLMKARVS